LQLTGKISLKLDFNSSLLLEYSRSSCWQLGPVMLQDQDHLFFQDQDRQIKTKTAFFKDH